MEYSIKTQSDSLGKSLYLLIILIISNFLSVKDFYNYKIMKKKLNNCYSNLKFGDKAYFRNLDLVDAPAICSIIEAIFEKFLTKFNLNLFIDI